VQKSQIELSLENCIQIKGIQIGKEEVKISLFAEEKEKEKENKTNF
jgi:hypothetical protein